MAGEAPDKSSGLSSADIDALMKAADSAAGSAEQASVVNGEAQPAEASTAVPIGVGPPAASVEAVPSEVPTSKEAAPATPSGGASAGNVADSVTRTAGETAAPSSVQAQSLDLPDFAAAGGGPAESNIDLLSDVELDVKIELGRAQMLIGDVLRLGEGSVVELDKLAGDPVDVLVNDRLVARGEVLVMNDSFCVRINEVLPGIGTEEAA